VENKNEAECPCELDIHASKEAQFLIVIEFWEYCRKILIRDPDAKREYDPGNHAKSAA
jgi:hypothetical protein